MPRYTSFAGTPDPRASYKLDVGPVDHRIITSSCGAAYQGIDCLRDDEGQPVAVIWPGDWGPVTMAGRR